MNISSSNVIAVVASALLLTGCQTTNNASSKDIPQFENISTLIPDIPDSDGDGVLDDIDACPMTLVNTVVDKNGCPVPVNLMGPFMIELRLFFERDSSKLQAQYSVEIEK